MEEQQRPAKPAQTGVLTRRTVLAAAGAGAIGVAAARLGAAASDTVAPASPSPSGARATLDWISPLDQEGARVAHLLRRATFGATAAQLEQARTDGYAKTLDRLIETPPVQPPDLAGAEDASQTAPLQPQKLLGWWLDWMVASPTPFAERMTLFWHGHFTSDLRKVTPASPYLYWQNRTWRSFALADLGTQLHEVTIDPAMLRYLDLGSSTGRDPNENYARELMELFTMGAGTFTEDDVKAAAKALAGWREPLTKPMIDALVRRAEMRMQAPKRVPEPDAVKTGVFEANRAYRGPAYAFLGETRRWDTESLLAKILAQDATAPHIARRVITAFAVPDPADDYVARMASAYRTSGYDTKTLMRAVFTSPEFTAPVSYRALVKTPVEYMVSVAKALGASAPSDDPRLVRLMLGSGQQMGQTLYDPPTVGGWPENASWVSSSAMLARANFATAAATTARALPSAAAAHETFLDSTLSAPTLAALNAARDTRAQWAVLFASPEFQLK